MLLIKGRYWGFVVQAAAVLSIKTLVRQGSLGACQPRKSLIHLLWMQQARKNEDTVN